MEIVFTSSQEWSVQMCLTHWAFRLYTVFGFRVGIGIRFQKGLLSAVASLRPGHVGDKDVSAVKRSFHFGFCVCMCGGGTCS